MVVIGCVLVPVLSRDCHSYYSIPGHYDTQGIVLVLVPSWDCHGYCVCGILGHVFVVALV